MVAAAPSFAASPEVKLAKRHLGVGPAGNLTVKLNCPTGEVVCLGTVTLKAHGGKQKFTTGTFIIVGGRTKALNLHLSRKALARLKKQRVLHARATVLARDSTGASHTTVASVTLKPI